MVSDCSLTWLTCASDCRKQCRRRRHADTPAKPPHDGRGDTPGRAHRPKRPSRLRCWRSSASAAASATNEPCMHTCTYETTLILTHAHTQCTLQCPALQCRALLSIAVCTVLNCSALRGSLHCSQLLCIDCTALHCTALHAYIYIYTYTHIYMEREGGRSTL